MFVVPCGAAGPGSGGAREVECDDVILDYDVIVM